MLAANIGDRQLRLGLLRDLNDLLRGESLLVRGFFLGQEALT